MATVKLTDKPVAKALGDGDQLVLIQGGTVKRIAAEKVGGQTPDYAVNDPSQPGYIANRPCYFTGNTLEDTVMDALSVPVGELAPYSGETMEAGEKYRLTIKGTSVELTAFAESAEGLTGTMIGDSFVEFYAAMNGGTAFAPTYGYCLGMAVQNGITAICLIPTDGTGAMLMAAFGLTSEELAAGTVSVTLTHLVPEAVKLSRHLLPDGIGGGKASNIHVVEAGFEDLYLANYEVGDVILLVGDTGETS